MNAKQRGFTLWELMMALMVAGIVLGLGIPSFQEFQRTNAMAAAANEWLTGLMLARAESVKRRVPVTLCQTADPEAATPVCGAGRGFIVFVDNDADTVIDAGEEILLRRQAPPPAITITADSRFVAFGANGFPRAGAGSATRVLFCDDRGNRASTAGLSAARALTIEATGRGTIRQEIADVTAAIAALGADC